MSDLDVPVLIVGGGGAGLTASMLLSKLGVDSLLVSALPTTSVLPKAHVLNQRTMVLRVPVSQSMEVGEHNVEYGQAYAPARAVGYFTAQLDGYAALDADGHRAIERHSAEAPFREAA